MSQDLIRHVEQKYLKSDPPQFEIGDTVEVHTRIVEGNKERVQVFIGTVIARSGGGTREMFTVRRIVQGEGVERKFPLHSPNVLKVVVRRHGKVRRAKLYYLRDRVGKATRLKERFKRKKEKVQVAGEEELNNTNNTQTQEPATAGAE